MAGIAFAALQTGANIDLTPGLALGTFVIPRRNAPDWIDKPDGMGGSVRMYTRNRTGSVTILLDAVSREHQLLVTMANLDIILRSLVGPIVVMDYNMNVVTYYNGAYISAAPDVPKGSATAIIPWRFNFENFAEQSFGFNANVVGD